MSVYIAKVFPLQKVIIAILDASIPGWGTVTVML